ncbi:MAG TPA: lysophospholipid acyltransferase family protein [Acidobacteriaceae bacterium]
MTTLPYRNPVRSGLKTAMLGGALAEVAASFAVKSLGLSGAKPLTARERANWLQDAACTVLARIGMEVVTEGDPPLHGLLVSNHLSYLDVLAYASIAPCVFVAKKEVRAWPVFGSFATMAGTIYVDRERRSANGGASALIEAALQAGVPVVLFPEGTSSDGESVLRFHSRYFEPAVRTHAVVTTAAIGYASSTAEEAALAYYGDDVFAPHLVRTLGQRNLEARVAFAPAGRCYADRKEAAHATQAEVELLRSVFARHPSIKPRIDPFRLTRAG